MTDLVILERCAWICFGVMFGDLRLGVDAIGEDAGLRAGERHGLLSQPVEWPWP